MVPDTYLSNILDSISRFAGRLIYATVSLPTLPPKHIGFDQPSGLFHDLPVLPATIANPETR
jgi:hypothetical protein